MTKTPCIQPDQYRFQECRCEDCMTRDRYEDARMEARWALQEELRGDDEEESDDE